MTLAVNSTWLVEPACGLRELGELLAQIDQTGLEVTYRFGESGAVGLPHWAAVTFTAEEMPWEIHCAAVRGRIERAGLAQRLVPA